MTEHSDSGVGPSGNAEPEIGPNTPAETGPTDIPPEYQEEEHYEEHKSVASAARRGYTG